MIISEEKKFFKNHFALKNRIYCRIIVYRGPIEILQNP